jgi:hypothetical protein
VDAVDAVDAAGNARATAQGNLKPLILVRPMAQRTKNHGESHAGNVRPSNPAF